MLYLFLQETTYSISSILSIVNYDKDTGWSSLLQTYFKKQALDDNTSLFVERINKIRNLGASTFKKQNINDLADKIGNVDANIVQTAKDVQNNNKTWDDFDTAVQKVSKSTSGFKTVASAAGTAIKSIGATALNMAGGFIIAEVIGLAVKGIYDIVNATEIAIEKGEEAKNAIKETYDTYNSKADTVKNLGKQFASDVDSIKTTGDAVDVLAKKYAELRSGVKKDNSNASLSSNEYEQYLDISNQLADSFPSLVIGADSAGNSILGLGIKCFRCRRESVGVASWYKQYHTALLTHITQTTNDLQKT